MYKLNDSKDIWCDILNDTAWYKKNRLKYPHTILPRMPGKSFMDKWTNIEYFNGLHCFNEEVIQL